MHRTVRRAVLPLASSAAVVALASCGSSSHNNHATQAAADHSLTNITVGTVAANINALPIWVAQAKGYYRREGLNVKLSALGGEALSSALQSGSVQFLEDSAASFQAAVAQHAPQIAVAAVGSGFPIGLIISTKFAREHQLTSTTPPAQIAKALIGSTGGSSSAPTTGQAGLFLNEFGVKLSQVKIATLSSPAADVAALKSGRIDWFLTSEPLPQLTESQGSGIVVGTPANVPAWTPAKAGLAEVAVTSHSYASDHPDIVRKFVSATQAATQYIAGHKQQVLPIAAAQMSGVPKPILLKAYSIFGWQKSAKMSASMWRAGTATNVKIGVLHHTIPFTENVDWTNKYIP